MVSSALVHEEQHGLAPTNFHGCISTPQAPLQAAGGARSPEWRGAALVAQRLSAFLAVLQPQSG